MWGCPASGTHPGSGAVAMRPAPHPRPFSYQEKGENRCAARDRLRRFSCLGPAGCPTRQFRLLRMEKRGHHHPKTVVPVTIVGIVPVANGAADVVLIVVERAPAQHAAVLLSLSPNSPTRLARGTSCYVVTFFQPPNSRPISAIISATCWYCPPVSHSHLAANRR